MGNNGGVTSTRRHGVGRRRKELDMRLYSHRVALLIRTRRERLHMSQAELGERIGVSGETVTKWESGHFAPHLDRIPEIAKALGVTVGRLLPRKHPEK